MWAWPSGKLFPSDPESPPRLPAGLLPLVALLVTAQLVGPVLGSKLVQVGPLVLDGALVLFPISYICGDAITEVYGYRLASRVIWITFGCQLLVVMATALVGTTKRPMRAFSAWCRDSWSLGWWPIWPVNL
jgi:uncharacterized PurR-regulated membrane protein YhhQ (DUF165 family)